LKEADYSATVHEVQATPKQIAEIAAFRQEQLPVPPPSEDADEDGGGEGEASVGQQKAEAGAAASAAAGTGGSSSAASTNANASASNAAHSVRPIDSATIRSLSGAATASGTGSVSGSGGASPWRLELTLCRLWHHSVFEGARSSGLGDPGRYCRDYFFISRAHLPDSGRAGTAGRDAADAAFLYIGCTDLQWSEAQWSAESGTHTAR
jgi:hypothetical protein